MVLGKAGFRIKPFCEHVEAGGRKLDETRRDVGGAFVALSQVMREQAVGAN